MIAKSAKASTTRPKQLAAKEYPKPYGTKAQSHKGNKVQPAFQKRNNQKGR
jgi:hypothetical protein